MTNSSLQDNLYWLLVQVGIRAKRGIVELAEKYDLTTMQLLALCSLQEGVSVPMNSISDFLVCDASNVTGIVDHLFSHGYIRREENPQDRRVKMLSLTPKGALLCQDILREIPTYQPASLNTLTTEQKQQLHDLLTQALQYKPIQASGAKR